MCSVVNQPSFPIASQRIAIIAIEWIRDTAGYLTANVTMRNDNTMDLRLVEFSFYYWDGFARKSTSYNTGTSIVPLHFVQDDPKLMGVDQIPGPWKSTQIRRFAIQTNQIVSCSTLSFHSTDFVVTLGVGA